MKVTVNDDRGHFHGAAPLLEPDFSLRLETAMRIFFRFGGMLPRIQLRKLLLLGGDLYKKAFPEITRAYSGRIKVLDQIDATPDQFQGPAGVGLRIRATGVAG